MKPGVVTILVVLLGAGCSESSKDDGGTGRDGPTAGTGATGGGGASGGVTGGGGAAGGRGGSTGTTGGSGGTGGGGGTGGVPRTCTRTTGCGNTDQACDAVTGMCTDICSAEQPCQGAGCCNNGRCVALCPTGCCAQGVCQPGTDNAACGEPGKKCMACFCSGSGGQKCIPWGPGLGGYCGCTTTSDCSGCGATTTCGRRFNQSICCAPAGQACTSAATCCGGGCVNNQCN